MMASPNELWLTDVGEPYPASLPTLVPRTPTTPTATRCPPCSCCIATTRNIDVGTECCRGVEIPCQRDGYAAIRSASTRRAITQAGRSRTSVKVNVIQRTPLNVSSVCR